MSQSLTNADALLKDVYVGPIVEQLNNKTYLLDQIDRDVDHIDHTGRRAIVPVHKNRNRGRGSTDGINSSGADSYTLPGAGQQADLDAIVRIKYHYYGIEITDAAVEASKSNEGAFVNLLERESKAVATDMRKDINRQAFGSGDGVLTACVSAAGAVVTVASVQYLQIGDTVDILVASSGATTAGITSAAITARSAANKTITTSPAVTTAGSIDATYSVYIAGNRNAEMDGLQNICSTGRNLHSINSSTAGNEFWDSNSISVGTSAAAPSIAGESSFEQLADQVGAVGQGEVEVFLGTRGIRRRLADTYQSQKRFTDAQATTVHGGYSAIMVNEIPVVADDDAPKQNVFALNRSALKWFEQTKPGWLESQDGQIFHLKTTGSSGGRQTVWQAWFRWYAALASVAPNRTGRLKFCTDDNPV